MNEKFIFYKDDQCSVELENLEGFIFVHLSLNKLSPSLLKKLRQGFKDVRAYAHTHGVQLLFAMGEDVTRIKLWQKIHPLYDLRQVAETGVFVGAWDTEN